MKLVEMYFALETIKTSEDYDNYIKRYEKELNQINKNIIKRMDNVDVIKDSILWLLQDFDIKEVLDQAETLFNDIIRHENQINDKLSPTMMLLRDEAINIEKEYE